MAGNKRLMTIIILVLAVCFAALGATLAYYQAQTDEKDNSFYLGKVDVEVPEIFPNPGPGDSALKQAWLSNTGSVDAYVRAIIVPTFRDSEGSKGCNVDYSTVETDGYILVTAPDGEKVYKLHLADSWETNWHFSSEDNVFYYRNVLPAKEQNNTPALLERVTRENAADWLNLNVDILADAMQSQGEAAHEWLTAVWGVTRIGSTGMLYWD